MTATRPITNDDLWAAIRGCQMTSKSADELRRLAFDHETGAFSELFASRVIARAARQCIAGRLYRKD